MAIVDMVDAIHASCRNIPTSTKKVGGYVTGSPDIQWTAADWAHFSNSGLVHINQIPGNPLLGNVLDMEAGAWTLATAIPALLARKAAGRQLALYFSSGNLTAVYNALDAVALHRDVVSLWVANWSLSRAQAVSLVGTGRYPIRAVQWASPSSNPGTLLPGTSQTLKSANCDLSVADASWFPVPVPTPPPPPPPPPPPTSEAGLIVTKDLVTHPASSVDGKTWTVIP